MASMRSTLRASRPLFNENLFASQTSQSFRQSSQRHGWQGGRRWQSTTGDAGQQNWFKRMWESEIGFKTVHFWAPVMKWGLVMAGVADMTRPAEKLSITQNAALTATGFIWTRWCLIIKPRNVFLAAANFFLGVAGLTQLTRIALHERSKNKSVGEIAEDAKGEVLEDAQEAKKTIKP